MKRPAYHRTAVPGAGWLALMGLASLLLWAGCAGPPAPVPPPAPAPPEPSREVQHRLLLEARDLYRQGRSRAAAQLLERWLRTYPASPLAQEAHWWLARSYEQAGDLGAALAQYRRVIETDGDRDLVASARSRLADVERSAVGRPRRAGKQAALSLSAQRLPPLPLLEGWVRSLAKAGITTLALEAGTEEQRGQPSGSRLTQPAGVYFRTDWAPLVRDTIGQLVPLAHQQGVAVYVSVDPWRMAWVDQTLGWQAQAYGTADGQAGPAPFLDLFHPAFQEYLIGFMTDLAGAGVDGVLFRAPPGADPSERFSRFAGEGVERDFGVRLDPASLAGGQKGYAPEVWRWLGWESRQSVKVLDRLARALRKRSAAIQVGLEVHEEAVTDPVTALVRYREDVLEARQGPWDFYLIASGPASVLAQGKGGPGVMAKAQTLLGERHQLWIGTSLPVDDMAKPDAGLPAAIERAAVPPGVGWWGVLPADPVP